MKEIADDVPVSSGEEAPQEVVAPQSYIERRAAELKAAKESQAPATQAPEALEPEAQGDPPETPEGAIAEEQAQVDQGPDSTLDLSQIDYEQITPETAAELARQIKERLNGENIEAFGKELGSGKYDDIAEIRKGRREAQEERDKAVAALEKISPNSNKFSEYKDEKKLNELEQSTLNLYNFYNKKARNNDWETNDVGEEGIFDQGQFYTKETMLGFLDSWEGDIMREIPKQRNYLSKSKESRKQSNKLAKKLGQSHEWFSNEGSEEFKSYKELMDNPSVSGAVAIFPDLEPMLMEAFAAKVGGAKDVKRPRLPLRSQSTPSSGDNGAVAPGGPVNKEMQEAQARVASGQFSANDWVKQRSAKYSSFFNK